MCICRHWECMRFLGSIVLRIVFIFLITVFVAFLRIFLLHLGSNYLRFVGTLYKVNVSNLSALDTADIYIFCQVCILTLHFVLALFCRQWFFRLSFHSQIFLITLRKRSVFKLQCTDNHLEVLLNCKLWFQSGGD